MLLVLPAALELRFMFMFEPFMLPALVLPAFMLLVLVFVLLAFVLPLTVTLALPMVTLALAALAFALPLVLLVLSPPPQAERLATPANARSAKVLRIDRSPELL